MRRSKPTSLLLVWPLGAALAACTVGPDFQRPTAETPAQWSASATTTADQASRVTNAPASDAGAWWTLFNDPELTSLIQRVVAANLDAKQAVLRIAEARAQRDVAAAAAWP